MRIITTIDKLQLTTAMVRNMKKFKTLALAAAVSAGLLASTGVMAAQDSALVENGPASGWFDIFLFNNAKAKIWGLRDFNFDDESGDTDNEDVCVYTNTDEFRMTVESANATEGKPFTLMSASDAVGGTYKVTIEDKADTPNTETWGDGGHPSGFGDLTDFVVGAGMTEPNAVCGATNATKNVNVKIDISRESSLTEGAYSDRVYLTVAPI